MSKNQTDTRLREGGRTYGVVISIGYDPNEKGRREDGRVKVRLFEQMDQSTVTDDDLSWYPVRHGSMMPSNRGMGSFPHGLMPGSVVTLDFDTIPGSGFITGTLPNAELNDETQDMHPESTSSSLFNVIQQEYREKGIDNTMETMWKQSALGKVIYEAKTSDEARKILNGEIKTAFNRFKGDRVENLIKFVKVPPEMGGARGFKSARSRTPTTSGAVAHNKADVRNATKWAENILGNKGELIKNHYNMINNLKNKVKAGVIDDAINSVGGQQLVSGAMNMIMQIVQFSNSNSNKPKEQKEEEELTIEELLRALYEAETGQPAVDENGIPTKDYLAWKKAYLFAAQQDEGTS